MRLSNQEIRNCIYSGPFNQTLMDLDTFGAWKKFKGHILGKKDRFRSVELILRMFAFMRKRDEYRGNLTKFLNGFMLKNRYLPQSECESYSELFMRVASILDEKITPLMDGKKIGFAQTEALLVSLGDNIDALESMTQRRIEARFRKFLAIPLLSSDGLRNDISNRDNVTRRIEAAIKAFS